MVVFITKNIIGNTIMTDNPLRQYFRRPSIYIKLPSDCKYYDDTVIEMTHNKEFPVYPMTAIDEITSKTPDALYNGTAVVDIIKSCIPAITDPWKINSIDLETILMAIRVASSGEELEVSSVCPKCNNDGKFGINLVALMGKPQQTDYSVPLKIRELEIMFRPLTFTETNNNSISQYEIQKSLIDVEKIEDPTERSVFSKKMLSILNEKMNDAIGGTISYIKTPEAIVVDKNHIKDFLLHCDRQTHSVIKEASVKLQGETQLKPFNIKCVECSFEYEQPIVLNITDFFE